MLQTIAACLIVKNEEKNLSSCLRSVLPWVDECVVVDTGSTDKTVEIAHNFGVKVKLFKWVDDFSAAYNAAIDEAKSDWVLCLDADEVVPDATGYFLRKMVNIAQNMVGGYSMNVLVPPSPENYNPDIFEQLKLFRNSHGFQFVGRAHEQIGPAIERTGYLVVKTDLEILHTHYDHSIEGRKKRNTLNLRILKKEAQEKPNTAYTYFNIGMTAHSLKKYSEAVVALEKFIQMAPLPNSVSHKAYSFLFSSYAQLEKYEDLLKSIKVALAVLPDNPEILYESALGYSRMGKENEAIVLLEKLITQKNEELPAGFNKDNRTIWAPYQLARFYTNKDAYDAAEKLLNKVTLNYPLVGESWALLAEVHLKKHQIEQYEHIVDRLKVLGCYQEITFLEKMAEYDTI